VLIYFVVSAFEGALLRLWREMLVGLLNESSKNIVLAACIA
jgi:hypothetical protein